MNVLSLIEGDKREAYNRSDGFWLGTLSASIAMALPEIERNPKGARRELQKVLDEFLESESPCLSPEVRAAVRGMR